MSEVSLIAAVEEPKAPETFAEILWTINSMVESAMDSGEDLTAGTNPIFDEITNSLAVKTDKYAFLIDRLSFEVEYFQAKYKEFQERARTLEKFEERLKDHIKITLINCSKSEVRGNNFCFKLSRVKPRLVLDPSIIPDEYKKQIIITEPDKEKIYDALAAGFKVEGAHLVESVALRRTVSRGSK